MKAIVLLTLFGALSWESVAFAQYGYGVPGGYFGSGGLYSGGGSPSGIPYASPAFGGMPYGSGSSSSFRGFTYSPYSYSSPSYGLLSPSFGGASPNLGFGAWPGFGSGTSLSPGFTAPVYGGQRPSIDFGTRSYRSRSHSSRDLFGAGRFLSSGDMSFYGTGFGCPPTWRDQIYIRPW